MLCRVSKGNTRQSLVCRVSSVGHSANTLNRSFIECLPVGTQQRPVCRVPAIWHSTKTIFKLKKPLPSACDLALGKEVKHNGPEALLLLLSLTHFQSTLLPAAAPRARTPLPALPSLDRARRAPHSRPHPPPPPRDRCLPTTVAAPHVHGAPHAPPCLPATAAAAHAHPALPTPRRPHAHHRRPAPPLSRYEFIID
jgi:hypothetical protein